MWCDNCLLLFPLRGGAMAWGVFMFLYSLAGSIFLLRYGQFFFFVFPEWFIYGGIGMGVAVLAALNVVALSNRSFIWTRVCLFLWPFVIVICGIRGIFMIWELNRGKDKIVWECENGGQLWTDSANAGYGNNAAFPDGICAPGFQTLWTAYIFGLLIDLAFQLYMFFLNWRYTKRIEHYRTLKGPMDGLYYS